MSALRMKLLQIAEEEEIRHQCEVEKYKEQISILRLENINLKTDNDAQKHRIDDLMDHSQKLAANLAQQARDQNTESRAIIRELIAAQFKLRELHDLKRVSFSYYSIKFSSAAILILLQ